MIEKWEYHVEKFPDMPEDDLKGLDAMLNRLGAEGWDLVQATGPFGGSGLIGNKLIFKRRIAVQSANQSNR